MFEPHDHDFAPLPPGAEGPPLNEEGYAVGQISDRLFWVTDAAYQMMFLRTDEGVVAFDAPPSIGQNILRAIKHVTATPVTHAIYSHHHADHAGAMVIYEGATLHGHSHTADFLGRASDASRPVPTETFTTSRTLEIAGETIQLDFRGPNHSPDNCYIFLPGHKTLMLVDVVFPGWMPFACLGQSQDIPAWIEAPAIALSYPFETFLGGHVNRPGTRDDVELHQEWVTDLRAECQRAIDTFDPRPLFAVAPPDNRWAFTRLMFDQVVAQISEAILPRWQDRLGGVDAFLDLNAYSMFQSLRIDDGQMQIRP